MRTLIRHGPCFRNSHKTAFRLVFFEKGRSTNAHNTFFFCLLQRFFTNVFNGCYAILMFIVVIFFLIYGVEVYFKVRTCLFILLNVMYGILSLSRSPILSLFGKSKFSLHRSVEVFCTRENAAFRWGLCRSKPFPRRLHLRVCPRLLPLPPRITPTTLTKKIPKKRKSQCI